MTERLRRVQAITYLNGKNTYIHGVLHGFSLNHEQYTPETVGHFPVAIVEGPSGQVYTCHADSIKFLDCPANCTDDTLPQFDRR